MVVSARRCVAMENPHKVINDLCCSVNPSHCKRDISRTNQPGEDHSSETRMRLSPFGLKCEVIDHK